jgi:hypothetical protein
VISSARQQRVRVLEALELRARQFRSREGLWPFRVPHEPLDLDQLIDRTLDGEGRLDADGLRSRTVLELAWDQHRWELRVITLPSGILLYCDSDGGETRILASARRGNPGEADGFFLERLAQSRGHDFGIEMAGPPPDRVRSSIADRELLADVFVELYEGSDAEHVLRTDLAAASAKADDSRAVASAKADFHAVVVRWLDEVLTAPPPGRRLPRVAAVSPEL